MPTDNMKFISTQKGYTLLFSVIVSTVVLSIAAFILSVSRKQFILSSAVRDSMNALYAADSGLECAVMNDNLLVFPKDQSETARDIKCGGTTEIDPIPGETELGVNAATTTFYLSVADEPDGACAKIVVSKYENNSRPVTAIESHGYNVGWNTSSSPKSCDTSSGPRQVERVLETVFQY
jgi:Tfp pilus assembly protein PilE